MCSSLCRALFVRLELNCFAVFLCRDWRTPQLYVVRASWWWNRVVHTWRIHDLGQTVRVTDVIWWANPKIDIRIYSLWREPSPARVEIILRNAIFWMIPFTLINFCSFPFFIRGKKWILPVCPSSVPRRMQKTARQQQQRVWLFAKISAHLLLIYLIKSSVKRYGRWMAGYTNRIKILAFLVDANDYAECGWKWASWAISCVCIYVCGRTYLPTCQFIASDGVV